MKLYILRHRETGRYVADRAAVERYGQSYTPHLERARLFTSPEAARQHHCVDSDELLPLAAVLCEPDDSNQ